MSRQFYFSDSWGSKNASNYWDDKKGMVGYLLRGEADIGSTPMFMYPDRIDYMDYIGMTTQASVRFIFRAPPLSYIANIYFMPFNSSVWISSGVFILISIGVIYLTTKIRSIFQKRINECEEAGEEVRFTDVVLTSIGAVCQMGPQIEPKNNSSRLTTIFLYIALLFLYTSYTANIVALLQSTSNNINTLEDLLHSPLELGVDDITYNRVYFESVTEPVRREIYVKKIAPPKKESNFMNTTHGMSLMRKGMFAFNVEVGMAYKYMEQSFYEHEKCGLVEIRYIDVTYPWMAIQKHSQYKEILKVK